MISEYVTLEVECYGTRNLYPSTPSLKSYFLHKNRQCYQDSSVMETNSSRRKTLFALFWRFRFPLLVSFHFLRTTQSFNYILIGRMELHTFWDTKRAWQWALIIPADLKWDKEETDGTLLNYELVTYREGRSILVIREILPLSLWGKIGQFFQSNTCLGE